MRLLLAVVFAVLGSGQCFAQEEKATIVGAGMVTCAEFAQAYQQNPQSTEGYFFAWAQGYMTGLNGSMFARKNLRAWPLEQQKQHIRAFCDKRPLANVRDAARDLFTNLPER
jgi:HdeA/HdeB family